MVPRPPEWSSRAALRVVDERERRGKSRNRRLIIDEAPEETLRRTERGLSDERFYARFRSDHWSPYECAAIFHGAKYALTVGVGKLFCRYTLLVYRHPWAFITLPAAVCLLLGVGFIFRNVVTDHERQYALPKSRSHDDAERYAGTFGDSQVRSEVIYVTSASGANLLNADFLNALWKFHTSVLDLEVTASLTNGEEKSTAAFSAPVDEQLQQQSVVSDADEKSSRPRLLSDDLKGRPANPSSSPPATSLPASDSTAPYSFFPLSAPPSTESAANFLTPAYSSPCAFTSTAASSPSETSAPFSSVFLEFSSCGRSAPGPSAETGMGQYLKNRGSRERHSTVKQRQLDVAWPQTLGSERLFGNRFWRAGATQPVPSGVPGSTGSLLQSLFPFLPFPPGVGGPPLTVSPPPSPPGGVVPPETPRGEEVPPGPTCVETLAHPKDRISGLACRPPVKAGHYAFSNLCWKDAVGICTPPDGVVFMYNSRGEFGNPLGYPRHLNWILATEAPTDIWLSHKGLQLAAGGSQAEGTQGFALRYLLSDDPTLRPAAIKWEHALTRHVGSAGAALPGASLYVKTEHGFAEDLASSVDPTGHEDLIYVLIAALLIFIYIGSATFSTNRYRSKMLVSLLGGLAAALGYCGGAGLCYLLGLEHTTTATAAPFLVLGIGVDDVFIIINSYSLTYTRVSAKERLRITMRDSGLSITVTTLTNLISFAIGSTSPYLAIKNFCVITAAGLFAGYLMCITFFLGCLTVDARYEEKKRLDEVCSCLVTLCCRRQAAENKAAGTSAAGSAPAASQASCSFARAAVYSEKRPSGRLSGGEERSSEQNDRTTKLASTVHRKYVSTHMITEAEQKRRLEGVRQTLLNRHANTVYECVTLQVAMALAKGEVNKNASPKNGTLQKFLRRATPSQKQVQHRSRESSSLHKNSQVKSYQPQKTGTCHPPPSKNPPPVAIRSGSEVLHTRSSQLQDYESAEDMEASWTATASQEVHTSGRVDHMNAVAQPRHITNGSLDDDLVLTHQIPVKTSSYSTPLAKYAGRKKRHLPSRSDVYTVLQGRLHSAKEQDEKAHLGCKDTKAATAWGDAAKFKRTIREREPHEGKVEWSLKNGTQRRHRPREGRGHRARHNGNCSHASGTNVYVQHRHSGDAGATGRQQQISNSAGAGSQGGKRNGLSSIGIGLSRAYNYEAQEPQRSAQRVKQKEDCLGGEGRVDASSDEERDVCKALKSNTREQTDMSYSSQHRGGRYGERRYPACAGNVNQRQHRVPGQLTRRARKTSYKRRRQRASVRLAARRRCGVGIIYGSVAQKRRPVQNQHERLEGGRSLRHYSWQCQCSQSGARGKDIVRLRILRSRQDQEQSASHKGDTGLSEQGLKRSGSPLRPARKTTFQVKRKRRLSICSDARVISPQEATGGHEVGGDKSVENISRNRGRELVKGEQGSETSKETSDKQKDSERMKGGTKPIYGIGNQQAKGGSRHKNADGPTFSGSNALRREKSSFRDKDVDEGQAHNLLRLPFLKRLFGRKSNNVTNTAPQPNSGVKVYNSHKFGSSGDSPTAPLSTAAQRDALLRILKPEDLAEPPGNVGRRWRLLVLHQLGRIIITPVVKLIILLGFTAIFSVAVIGCIRLKRGLDPRNLSRDDSSLKKFFDVQANYFSSYGDPVVIFFLDPQPPCSAEFKSEYAWLHSLLESRPYTKLLVDGLDTYLKSPLGGLSPSDNTAACMQMLRSWLQTPVGSNFAWQFIWKGDFELKAFQIQLVPRYYSGSQELSDFMSLLREDLSKFKKARAHAYNKHFIFYESDSNVLVTTLANMAWAVLAVTLVFLIMLPSLWSAAMVIFILVLIDVAIMGFMYYWDLPLNMLTMVNLIISIGFSIDYASHMCHTFAHCVGRSRDMRIFETLVLIGNPILHGVMSTQLGVLVLAYTDSFVLRVFFKMMTLVLTLAFAHGAILLPVLLSLFGPMGSREEPLDVALTNFRRGLTLNRIMSKKYSE